MLVGLPVRTNSSFTKERIFHVFGRSSLVMLKFALFVALLCATVFVGECALEKPTLTQHLTVTMPKSTTVAMRDHMYTLSIDKSNIHVNSSDANHKPCDMKIDPAKDSIEGEMKVIVSDDMMFVISEHSEETVDGKDLVKYTLLMINPHDCTVKSADVPKAERWNRLPELVVQKMGVDVFFPKMQVCAPCQFMNDGTRKMDVPPQLPVLKAARDGWINSYVIRKMNDDYLYAQETGDDKTALKVLDGKKMSVLKEKQLDRSVDTLVNTKVGTIGVCSKKYDRMMADITAFKEIVCERIDSKLESHAQFKIPIGPYSRPISSISYDVDKDTGHSYVAFAEDQNLRIFVHDDKGKELKSYDMGEIDKRFEKYRHQPMYYNPYGHWNVRGFIVGREYCLVTEQVSNDHEVDLHDVKCINLEK